MLDPVIHPLNRLRICATLKSVGAVNDGALVWTGTEMKFSALRDAVGLSDASLSKQLKALEEADYIRRHRDYGVVRAMDVVWVSLTPRGLKAFDDHIAALREIAGD
ncbi:transcriptional regulator [Actinomyces ruminis]|uniref:MarR family transcriptional regulator n=1 Tax=Actinomyces ruminis TaxID=1937003 RepID=A0ABX4MA31_9ACTO|nr:transcriptional regulator [Actinomyces ruminis]PHP52295.1 MarR family transcriptional regulator [Actinomyces ruminis]